MKYLLFIFLISLVACKNSTSEVPQQSTSVQIPSDFLNFYDRFHQDSLFQVNHIIFPLAQKTDSTKWMKENWIMHKPFNSLNGEFSRQFENVNGLIFELMQDKTGTVTIERRFSEMGGEYQLIYYNIRSKFGN